MLVLYFTHLLLCGEVFSSERIRFFLDNFLLDTELLLPLLLQTSFQLFMFFYPVATLILFLWVSCESTSEHSLIARHVGAAIIYWLQ